MQVPAELESWFLTKIKQLIVESAQKAEEAGETPESYLDYFGLFQLLAMHLSMDKNTALQRSAVWFSTHGCPVLEHYQEKYHLISRLRDNSITYKDIFPK